jgi:GTP-binding protein HflX
MEEAVSADLVLHVIDASHPQHEEQREVGEQVLADLGVDGERVIEVFNKCDAVHEEFVRPRRMSSVLASALTGKGIDYLIDAIRSRERSGGEVMHLVVPHEEPRVAARVHALAEVYEQAEVDGATRFRVWVPKDAVHLFQPYSAEGLLKAAEVN